MKDEFWSQHLTMAEAARQLGCTRQNIKQRVARNSISFNLDPDGKIGIPISYVLKTKELKEKGNEQRKL